MSAHSDPFPKPPPGAFSFLYFGHVSFAVSDGDKVIEHKGVRLYHQGDSHGPGQSWDAFAGALDAMIIWPVYVDSYVLRIRPAHVIFHHMDRFEPGNFFCNKDPQRELDYWRYRYPEAG